MGSISAQGLIAPATGGTSNVSTFTGLIDTPSSYSGKGNECVVVKSDETGLEFSTCATGGNGTSNHSKLTNLQGGTSQQWYHLNLSAYNKVVNNAWDWITDLSGFTTDDLAEGTTNKYDNQSWDQATANDIYVEVKGDSMTGALNMTGNNIDNVGNITDGDSNAQIKFDNSNVLINTNITIHSQMDFETSGIHTVVTTNEFSIYL